jgi:hypothetical protein
LEDEESPIMRKVFAVLFPFGPAWNSMLGTFHISSWVPSSTSMQPEIFVLI